MMSIVWAGGDWSLVPLRVPARKRRAWAFGFRFGGWRFVLLVGRAALEARAAGRY